MNSILSYPERDPNYGSNKWRGNAAGQVIKDLIEHFEPKEFLDICEGSKTSRDVCKEMNLPYFGLDLNTGFDFTRDSAKNVIGREVDMCFSHPPYHDMIKYDSERAKHNIPKAQGMDISNCGSVEEFIELGHLMLLNMREATVPGGTYCTLIGDYRKNGRFYSFQSDFIKMLPKNELISVTIKLQHNAASSFLKYTNSKSFVSIQHEYCLIWEKQFRTLANICFEKATEFKDNIQVTWKNYVRMSLMNLGGVSNLNSIYEEVYKVAGAKLTSNTRVKEKIRQVLQRHFVNVSRGVWSI